MPARAVLAKIISDLDDKPYSEGGLSFFSDIGISFRIVESEKSLDLYVDIPDATMYALRHMSQFRINDGATKILSVSSRKYRKADVISVVSSQFLMSPQHKFDSVEEACGYAARLLSNKVSPISRPILADRPRFDLLVRAHSYSPEPLLPSYATAVVSDHYLVTKDKCYVEVPASFVGSPYDLLCGAAK